ncbi:MAG: PAS domain S-box protein [Gemmatimonadota bacterium]
MALRKSLAAYGVALAAVVTAVGVRLSLTPILGETVPFTLTLIAITFAAWYGGTGPGLFALVVGGLGVDYLLLVPTYTFAIRTEAQAIGLGAFVLLGLAAIWLVHTQRRARIRSETESDLLRITLASIGDGIITTDTEDLITRINPAAEALTGWTNRAAIGQPLDVVFRIVHEEHRQPVECLAPGASRPVGPKGPLHPILIARDGTERLIEESCATIKNDSGESVGTALMFRDIAERRSQQAALQRSELELRDLFDNASIGLHWVGPDGTVLRVNQAELDLLGYAREDFIGRKVADFHADDDAIAEILRCLAIGESLHEYPARLRHKDGSIREVLISSNVLFENGEFIHTRCFTLDVTARNAAAAAMRESEATLRAFYDTSPACMGIVEPTAEGDLLHIYDNPASCRFFGADPGTLEGKRSLADIGVDPIELQGRLVRYAESERLGEPVHFEQRFDRPDGVRWLSATVCPIGVGPSGRTRFCFVAEDVTERKESEVRLSASEERLRLALEAGGMGVWDWNIKTGALSWTEQLEPLHGLAPGTFGGTFEAFQELILEADRPRVSEAIGRAVESGSGFNVEFRNPRPNGDIAWIAGTGRALPGTAGQSERMIGIGLDVTQRKRAQQTSQFLADASAALAVPTDLDTILQNVAALGVPYFADWISVDFLEPDGSLRRIATAHVDPRKLELAEDLHRRYPPDLSQPQGVGNILRTGQAELVPFISDDLLERSVRDVEQLRIARELGLRSYIGVPLTVRGRTLGAITFITAESGHRYDERDLAVASDLARRAGIAIENSQLYGELQKADRRKDEFLATLAHELRNPLAPISNSLALMKRAGADPDLIAQSRGAIERQLSQLVRLVDDLLDVSRITRDRLQLKRGRVELASVVHHAVDGVRHLCERAGHELTTNLPPEPVYLDADPVRLTQMLGNLLINACKYTPPGGRISLTASCGNGAVMISVRDNGVGISAEMLPQIFDLFTQADRAEGGDEGGLGIGLSLVKRLAELHQGTVTARSEGLGRGSEFELRLPILQDQSAAPAEQATSTRVERSAGRRVLVVDDNRDSADSLAMLLELEGHETQTAYDGQDALVRAESFRPELVLLDIGLPKLNGYEVCRTIREQSWGKEMVVIAQTGWGQEEDRRRSREEGFDSHLVKPIDHGALLRLLAASFPAVN